MLLKKRSTSHSAIRCKKFRSPFSNCRRPLHKQMEVFMNKGTSPRRGGACRGGSAGACGGTRRQDGSGGGAGNRGTKKQPPKK